MNPNYLSIEFGAKSNKNVVQQKGQRMGLGICQYHSPTNATARKRYRPHTAAQQQEHN